MSIRLQRVAMIALMAVGLSGCETIYRAVVEWGRGNSSAEDQCRQGGCPPQPSPASTGSQTRLDIPQAGDPAEREQLGHWMEDARAVLRSDRFRANLASLSSDYPIVYFRGRGSDSVTGSVSDLQAIIDATGSAYYFRTLVRLTGNVRSDDASTGWSSRDADVTMTLGRLFFGRWQSENAVVKSCAINTAAHEITHVISIRPDRHSFALMDRDRRSQPAGVPAGSYLAGTVAQCTWLQDRNRIPATAAALRSCVAVFGSRHFNNLRCDQFNAVEPVFERDGLPDAASD